MPNPEVLQSGTFYHIFNRGINGENLFHCEAHFQHFLGLYSTYIDPVAETYAWVLMPNHFHLLVRIKADIQYRCQKPNGANERDLKEFELRKWETVTISSDELPETKTPVPFRHFSHLFNAYTKYFNKKTSRHGNLFERPFKRKEIENSNYLKNVVIYINHNPVHHGFCLQPSDYPWSSYLTCISVKHTKLQRDSVIGWFDNEANFVHLHNGKVEVEQIEHWLEL